MRLGRCGFLTAPDPNKQDKFCQFGISLQNEEQINQNRQILA